MAATLNIFESGDFQRGERATESAHRKIELQAPEDLSYIIANVQRVARSLTDRHVLPEVTSEHEAVIRQRIEEKLDSYINDTFNKAKDGMSINGMDSKEMDAELAKAQEGEEIEPFDAKLAQRVQALAAQIEKHTLELANLRRTAPMETARQYQTAFDAESERDDARLRRDEARKLEAAKNTRIDIGQLERQDEIQATWQYGTDNLMSLASKLGGTVAKMERAQQAVDILDSV